MNNFGKSIVRCPHQLASSKKTSYPKLLIVIVIDSFVCKEIPQLIFSCIQSGNSIINVAYSLINFIGKSKWLS